MGRLKFIGLSIVCILFFSLILFSACERKEDIFVEDEMGQAAPESLIGEEQQKDDQAEVEKNLDKFLKLLLEKENELKEKEKNLEKKLAELEEKQTQLNDLDTELKEAESKFKNFRIVTYIIFGIGLVLIVTGLIMISFRGKPKKATPAPEVKPEKKVQQKEAPKPGVEKKAGKKESPKPVAKTKKIKTEKKPK